MKKRTTISFLNRIRRKISLASHRGRKRILQQLKSSTEKSALFVFGCQRSGTSMILNILDQDLLNTWVFHGGKDGPAFENFRINNVKVRQKLIDGASCRYVVFKPLLDLQFADILLDSHPGSKGLWIYRGYQDVANSAIKKWGHEQYRHIQRIAQPDCQHWICERVDQSTRDLMRNLLNSGLSDADSAVLKWYVRNQWYFTLHLMNRREQVLLVKYEDLVINPEYFGSKIFQFLGIGFNNEYVHSVFPTSINKKPLPDIRPGVKKMAMELLGNLGEIYLNQNKAANSKAI